MQDNINECLTGNNNNTEKPKFTKGGDGYMCAIYTVSKFNE